MERVVQWWLVMAMALLAGCTSAPTSTSMPDVARAAADGSQTQAALLGGTAKTTKLASLHLPPLGLVLREMTAEERESRRLDHGVWVVVAVGASAIAGVREDDVILSVDNHPVNDVDHFWMMVDRTNWRCTLGILREGKYMQFEIGKVV